MIRHLLITILFDVPAAGVALLYVSHRLGQRYADGYRDGWDVCDQNWRAGGIARPSPVNAPNYDAVGRNPNIFPSPPKRSTDEGDHKRD